jgi:hypothetical protein
MTFRTLKENEIEVRVGTIKQNGASLLLYKDARVDMAVLDEDGRPWKREHQTIDGKLFCTVSIWDDSIKEWVARQDVGVESNTEATKGEASDSFKRACFNWGIGRELYTAPFIWIKAADMEIVEGEKDKYGKVKFKTYDKFSVEKIKYDESTREIIGLAIRNDTAKKRVFIWQKEG